MQSSFRLGLLTVAALLLSGTGLIAQSKVSKVKKATGEKPASIPIVYGGNYRLRLGGLEKLHPFDIAKYDKIFSALKREGYVTKKSVHAPESLKRDDLLLVHTEEYLKSLKDRQLVAMYLEAPPIAYVTNSMLKKNVVQPFINASGGTLKAARLALERGAAINLGGGYHHAKPNVGEGFCLIADVPIAIRKLQAEGKIKTALIIDTDAHQGNGTILCLKDDPSTYTFSIHGRNIYPVPKEVGDWDVALDAGQGDKKCLAVLKKALPVMFQQAKPDIVFHVSGCDMLAQDPLANLTMTPRGIAKRDAMIFEYCRQKNVPYVMTLAGGYSKNAWSTQWKSIRGLMDHVLEEKRATGATR